jgi:hypothetical protein
MKEGDHLEDSVAAGRIILKLIFNMWKGEGHGLDRTSSEQGQMTHSCECGFHKSAEFLD